MKARAVSQPGGYASREAPRLAARNTSAKLGNARLYKGPLGLGFSFPGALEGWFCLRASRRSADHFASRPCWHLQARAGAHECACARRPPQVDANRQRLQQAAERGDVLAMDQLGLWECAHMHSLLWRAVMRRFG